MKKPRFSLKTLLFVVTLCAVSLRWLVDHIRQRRLIRRVGEAALYHMVRAKTFEAEVEDYRNALNALKEQMGEKSN